MVFNGEKTCLRLIKKFMQDYNKDSDKRYILEVDVKYPKELYQLRSDLPFLRKRMKTDKCKKITCIICMTRKTMS